MLKKTGVQRGVPLTTNDALSRLLGQKKDLQDF